MTSPNSLPYIGSKISLISNAGIRYEGILYNINTVDSTVGLSAVRTYGTEGRKPGGEVPPSDDVYDYIIFRGKDIQDLTVSDNSPPDDPAIVAINPLPSPVSQVGVGGHNGLSNHYSSNYMVNGSGMPRMGNQSVMATQHHPGPDHGDVYHGRMGGMNVRQHAIGPGVPGGLTSNMYGDSRDDLSNQRRGGYQPASPYVGRRGNYGYRGSRGRGGYVGGPRRIIGELSAQPNQTLKSQVEAAFDFDESNRKFDRTLKEASDEAEASSASESKENDNKSLTRIITTPVYDKKLSFFDRISCETLDRQTGHGGRVDRSKQRQLDLETFGQAAALAQSRRGGPYRRSGMNGMMMQQQQQQQQQQQHSYNSHQWGFVGGRF